MSFVFSFIIFLFCESYAIIKIKDSFKNKNIAFVENLKQDLRRNNDDYTDILRRSGLLTSNRTQLSFDTTHLSAVQNRTLNISHNDKATERTGATSEPSNETHSLAGEITMAEGNFRRKYDKEDERYRIIEKIRRRVNDAFPSEESREKKCDDNPKRRAAIVPESHVVNNTAIMSANNISPTRGSWNNINKVKQKLSDQIKVFSKINNKLTPLTTLTPLLIPTMNSKPVNQLQEKVKMKKIEKFKKFVEKNKGLLKEFISSKVAIQTPAIPVPQKPQLRKKKRKYSKKLRDNELQEIMRDVMNGLEKKESLGRPPRAELLDMAPARGGHIHQKRLRGRLCARHVLVPEGPKYNSGGHPYVPPHAAARAREYNATPEPRLLLPRCCNCCRKSVLGCE